MKKNNKKFQLKNKIRKIQEYTKQLEFQSALLDEIGDGLTATDLEGNITYTNKTVNKWLKKTREELIGKSVSVYGDNPAHGATQKKIINETLANGKWAGEVANYTKDGQEIILECHTWLINDSAGNPVAMCGVSRDITERKKRLADLEKHRSYLEALGRVSKLLLPSAPVIPYGEYVAAVGLVSKATRVHALMATVDDTGKFCIIRQAQWCRDNDVKPVQNKASDFFMENIWPKIQNECKNGRHLAIRVADEPQDIQKFWAGYDIKAMLAIPVMVDNELYGIISIDKCDNDILWTETEIEFLHASAIDLSHAIKRAKIKEELRAERDFAQNLIETAQTIVLVLDNNGDIVQFNPYLEKLSGYLLEEVEGKNWFDTLLPAEDREKIRRLFSKSIADINTNGNVNPIVTKDGRLCQIEWYDKTIKNQHGNIIGVLSTGHDVTKRLETENQFRKAHEDLEKMVDIRTFELKKTNRQLLEATEQREHVEKLLKETEKLAAAGKLAAQIAHEINNPLAGIKNSFLLIKDAIPEDHQYFGYVGRIEKEIARVSQIVRQMFDLYRPGSEPADRFNLYETINDIVELLKVALHEKFIEIELSCDKDINVILPEGLFRQVIYNLLQNAVEASPKNGRVEIDAKIEDFRLNIAISDNGKGIDETIREKIFEPFFTTASGGPRSGLGLGLAITKDIVSAMEGDIIFVNNNGNGTKFKLMVPIKND